MRREMLRSLPIRIGGLRPQPVDLFTFLTCTTEETRRLFFRLSRERRHEEEFLAAGILTLLNLCCTAIFLVSSGPNSSLAARTKISPALTLWADPLMPERFMTLNLPGKLHQEWLIPARDSWPHRRAWCGIPFPIIRFPYAAQALTTSCRFSRRFRGPRRPAISQARTGTSRSAKTSPIGSSKLTRTFPRATN